MPPRVGDIPRIKSQNPISLREVSRASTASGEKITLPEAPVGVPGSSHVAVTNLAGGPVKVPLPRARNPKGHRFRCRVPEFWPDFLSPSDAAPSTQASQLISLIPQSTLNCTAMQCTLGARIFTLVPLQDQDTLFTIHLCPSANLREPRHHHITAITLTAKSSDSHTAQYINCSYQSSPASFFQRATETNQFHRLHTCNA